MIKKQWQLAIDSIEQFVGQATGDTYNDIVWNSTPISEQELVAKYNEVKRNLAEWKDMLEKRNQLLLESDWTQSRDVVLENDAEWKVYRQALRNLTDSFDPWIEAVIWPDAPTKENN